MLPEANEPNEQTLIFQTLAGDNDAFAVLVRLHQARVYNIAYRMVGQSGIAQNLAQETFLRAFRALDTFDSKKPFAPWLYRIATNLSINWIKRAKLPAISMDVPYPSDETEAEPLEIPDTYAEPATRFAQTEFQNWIRQAVLDLPAAYRVMVELRHFQELSYEEMAATLNLPLSTVKTRLFRARRMLRDQLEDELSA